MIIFDNIPLLNIHIIFYTYNTVIIMINTFVRLFYIDVIMFYSKHSFISVAIVCKYSSARIIDTL